MAMTPAQRFRMKALAQIEAAQAREYDPLARATGYELMMAKLQADKTRLKTVQSIENKANVKREVLPDYIPYIEGILSAGKGNQDEVIMTIMVWRIDAGDYAGALQIADYAIKYKLLMPDRYQRTTGCLIAEEISDMQLRENTAGRPMDVNTLLATGDLTAKEDMPDEVRAKLHKAIGYALTESAPSTAIIHLRRALELHDKSGVKKDIERLERVIAKQDKEQAGTTPA